MKIPLSVVIITKNEEKKIEECLASVSGWAEELIVVDDDSNDKTREIASRYTNKIFTRKMDIEGKHRNWANSQAKFEWILSLDADERVTKELQKEIEGTLESKHDYFGFTIPRKNFLGNYWMRWGGQYPAAQLKLFKKDKFKWEEADVHPRAFMEEGKCGHLSAPLLHYSYADFSDFLKKLNNQTTLEARKWIEVYKVNPKKANRKMNLLCAIWRTIDRFIRTYLVKQGWRDGFIGFMVSIFASMYQMTSYSKYRVMKKILLDMSKNDPLDDPHLSSSRAQKNLCAETLKF